MSVYFISETWFNSAACLQSSPERQERWGNPKIMTNSLIAAWNNRVRPEDRVYHLGNVATGTRTEIAKVLARLQGKKFLLPSWEDYLHMDVLAHYKWEIFPNIQPLNTERVVLTHYPLLRWPNDAEWKLIYGLPDARMSVEHAMCPAAELFDFAPVSLPELRSSLAQTALAAVRPSHGLW